MPTEPNTPPSRPAGGLFTSASAAPVLAGVLAVVAASFLIGFSVWAQNVVLEGTEGATVQANQRAGSSQGPLVVRDLDQLATSGEEGDGTDSDGDVVLVASSTPDGEVPSSNNNDGPGPAETVSGHIGAPHPGSSVAQQPRARAQRQCPPRQVRGAREGRREPPGHCRNGEPDGFLAATARKGAAARTVIARAAVERTKTPRTAPASSNGKSSHASSGGGHGHAYGHSKAQGRAFGLHRLLKVWRGKGHAKH